MRATGGGGVSGHAGNGGAREAREPRWRMGCGGRGGARAVVTVVAAGERQRPLYGDAWVAAAMTVARRCQPCVRRNAYKERGGVELTNLAKHFRTHFSFYRS